MNETQSNPSCADDELDLRELFSVLWKGKSIIALFTGLAAFLSLTVALSIPNSYQSTALLAPKSHGGAGSLSRLASQYGGLASLAGMNLGGLDGDGMSKSALALEKMRSFAFFEQYVYEDLLLEIMAVKSWNASTRQLELDSKVYDEDLGTWLREVNTPRQSKPSAQEAFEKFKEHLSISENKQAGLINISVEHQSPVVAKRWVELIVHHASEDLRLTDIREAEDSIRFLETQREKTRIVSLDEMFAQLIEEQIKTIMLANVSKEYVFDVIDPPIEPEVKSKPSRAVICVLGTFLEGCWV